MTTNNSDLSALQTRVTTVDTTEDAYTLSMTNFRSQELLEDYYFVNNDTFVIIDDGTAPNVAFGEEFELFSFCTSAGEFVEINVHANIPSSATSS